MCSFPKCVPGSTLAENSRCPEMEMVKTLMDRKWLIVLSILLLLASACDATPEATEESGPLEATGYIEAEEIAIAPEVGGRIVAILADVQDEVEIGTTLVQLDARIAQAQVAMAEAKVAEMQAKLDLARNATTEQDLRIAEATFAQAQAGRIGACQAWTDTLAILEDPQELDRQIAVTHARLRAAEAGRNTADAYKDVAEIGVGLFEDGRRIIDNLPDKYLVYDGPISDAPLDLPQEILDFLEDNPPPDGTYNLGDTEITISDGNVTVRQNINVSLPVDAHFAPNRYWQAWVGLNTAQTAYDGLKNVLYWMITMRDNPTQIKAQVDEAAARCRQAKAQETMAQTKVDGLRNGATQEEIATLEAMHQQSLAELAQAYLTLEQQTLTAPAQGIILERTLEPGELAAPDVPLLVLADIDVVHLTLYLPSRDLGRVSLGQSILIRIGSFPERIFEGEVAYVGKEAEFPPSNVPQPEERATLIFAVRVRIQNPEHLLKPGVLADATFQE